jgi:hypothetical protein
MINLLYFYQKTVEIGSPFYKYNGYSFTCRE